MVSNPLTVVLGACSKIAWPSSPTMICRSSSQALPATLRTHSWLAVSASCSSTNCAFPRNSTRFSLTTFLRPKLTKPPQKSNPQNPPLNNPPPTFRKPLLKRVPRASESESEQIPFIIESSLRGGETTDLTFIFWFEEDWESPCLVDRLSENWKQNKRKVWFRNFARYLDNLYLTSILQSQIRECTKVPHYTHLHSASTVPTQVAALWQRAAADLFETLDLW